MIFITLIAFYKMNIELLNPNNNEVKEKIIENAKYVFKNIDIIIRDYPNNSQTNFKSKIHSFNLIIKLKFDNPKYNIYDLIYKLYEECIFTMISNHLCNFQEYILANPHIYQMEIENNIKYISELYTNKFEYNFDLFKTDDDNNRLSNSNLVYFKALYETLKNFNMNDVIIDMMNKKINDLDKSIKDNYETLNNKIIDISNKCETQNNRIFNKIILFIYLNYLFMHFKQLK
jgi:hypothetical protein